MAAIVVLLGVLTLAVGERIGVNQGMGWDGQTYVQWARDFNHELFDLGTTEYHAQRVLPAAAVHYAMRVIGVTATTPNILLAFTLFNILLLAIAAVLWAHLGHAMKWRPLAVWVGFVALFAGFANARHALYYPALTDTAAFTLGMAMIWGYLTRRSIVVAVVAALGAVTWPALPAVAVALLVVPRLDEPLPPPDERWRHLLRAGSALIALAVTAWFLWLALMFLAHPVDEPGLPKFATWVRRDLLPVTLVSVGAFLAAGWYCVVHQPGLWNLPAYVRSRRWRYVPLAVIAVVAIWYARDWWIGEVATKGRGPTRKHFLYLQTVEALRGPLWGIVHHVVYFGPIVLVAARHWRRVCGAAGEWGYAALLGLAMIVMFGAASESRQWIHLLPLLVAATIAATEWTRWRAVAFTLLSLAWSKLWLSIGYNAAGDWHAFPTQRYFMQMGPWASDPMYLVHLVAAAVTLAVLVIVERLDR